MTLLSRLDPRALLGHAFAYGLHSRLAASELRKRDFVSRFLRLGDGDRVLDIGCGTAALLAYMPGVIYVGFDINERYIDSARKRYGSRGRFHHRALTAELAQGLAPFDVAMAIGVLHHLDDLESETLFRVARDSLRAGGRLVTCDGAFVPGQSPIASVLLRLDRGKYVRSPQGYETIARRVFTQVESSVHHDLNSFPYTHCVLTCMRT